MVILSPSFLKKKAKELNYDSDNDSTDITSAKHLIKDKVQDIVNRYNKDPKIKKKIRKDINDAIIMFPDDNYNGFDKNNNVPKFVCYVFEENDHYMTIALDDHSQVIRVGLSDTIRKIKDELLADEEVNSLPALQKITTGDGDEGCIYVYFKR